MNDLYLQLKVAVVSLSGYGQLKTVSYENNALCTVLSRLNLSSLVFSSLEDLNDSINSIVDALERQFDYYDASEMKVNEHVNEYLLKEVMRLLWAEKPVLPEAKTVAMTVCAYGNKPGDFEFENGVGELLDYAGNQLQRIRGFIINPSSIHFLSFEREVNQLQFVEKVLHIIDVFNASRLGMLAGLEEYGAVDEVDIDRIPDPDWVSGMECSTTNDCKCGCAMDHGITILQGLEDFMDGQETDASRYMLGVAYANNISFVERAGNEGQILDSIKEMGQAAWKALVESFNAIMELIKPEEAEKEAEVSVEVGEENKKALQAMKDKTAQINDAAKQGIIKLADATYPNGEMTKIVNKLSTAQGAGGVIDGLLGLMRKEVRGGDKLQKAQVKAKAALDELKQSSDKAGRVDEKNKDVVNLAKNNVKTATAKAKAALKEARTAAQGNTKRINAIKKAIAGITPKIFSKTKEGEAKP